MLAPDTYDNTSSKIASIGTKVGPASSGASIGGFLGEVPWHLAACRDGTASMLELFFSEQIDDIARAKAICIDCPVIETCLDGALARREPWGVWGGQLFVNGKVLAQKRKRGRPPKNAVSVA